MARSKSPIKKIRLCIYIPEDVYARALVDLYSPLEGRVPLGVWSNTMSGLLEKALDEAVALKRAQKAANNPTLETLGVK